MIYETEITIPGLYLEDDPITWDWFKEKCVLRHEICIEDGFLIKSADLSSYYIESFRSYIEFEYYDSDSFIYDSLVNTLDYICSFIEYYTDSFFICIIGS